MKLTKELSEFLALLKSHNVEFLLVGAYALAVYLPARMTQDLDVWIQQSEANVSNLREALEEFGVTMSAEQASDFVTGRKMVRIGMQPNQIDILSFLGPPGQEFEYADIADRSLETDHYDVLVRVPSVVDLLASKLAANRAKDQGDIAQLRELIEENS